MSLLKRALPTAASPKKSVPFIFTLTPGVERKMPYGFTSLLPEDKKEI